MRTTGRFPPQDATLTGVSLSVDRAIAIWIGTSTFATELGYTINPPNGQLFPLWQISALGPGNYGMHIQDYDFQQVDTIANYQLNFIVTPVPEPGTLTLFVLGSALLWCAARRRGKSKDRMQQLP